MSRGRHARRSGPGFYRDALFLVAGILVVGALVFGGLSLWAGGRDADPPGPTATVPETEVERTTSTVTTSTTTTTSTTLSESTSTTRPPETTTSTVTTTPTTDAVAPSETRVVVLNSIGVTGLAGELSAELADLGYQMAEADNYTPELADTTIFHGEGFAAEAQALVEAVPDATVAPDPELADTWGVDVVVVIGRSYQE